MKVVTVEEQFMGKKMNDRFNKAIKSKDKFEIIL